MSQIEQLSSVKGEPMILHEGYIYSEKNKGGTGRKKPQFDHKLWNIHDRVVATVPRSNNSVEGWHNAFASRVAISHPTIVKLGEKIRREQSKFEVGMAKILQGHNIKTKKACYRKLDERITRLANSFDPTQLDQFLKNMAANITLWAIFFSSFLSQLVHYYVMYYSQNKQILTHQFLSFNKKKELIKREDAMNG
ncbi:unnamed protein product [Rotaria socialis]